MKYDFSYIESVCAADAKKCMRCGKCSGSCPAFNEMEIHPHEYVSLMNKGKLDKAFLKPESMFACLSCMTCSERCPRGVEPSRIIEALRNAYLRQQGETNLKFEEVPCIASDEKVPQQLLVTAFRKYTK